MKGIAVLISTSTPVVMNSGSPGPLTKQRIGFAWWSASFKRKKNQIWDFLLSSATGHSVSY